MNFDLGTQLHKVASGRIWIRGAVASPDGYGHSQATIDRYKGAVLLVGVVELPTHTDPERMHSIRLNSSLWMDTKTATRPMTYMGHLDIKECDIDHLMTQFKFRSGFLPDSYEVFVRRSLIKHDEPGKCWSIIAAPLAKRPAALPKDGLYEFDAAQDGFRHISDNIYIGSNPIEAIRDCIWGPGGKYGTTTSLEPEHFPAWLKAERARPPASYEDPKFRSFMKLMEERNPELHVFTAEQKAARDATCKVVLKELIELETAGLPLPVDPVVAAPPAPAVRRPRP
jgi:hypothetical protein